MSEERIKALEDFVVQMRTFTETVNDFMRAQAEAADAASRAYVSVGQTMGVFAEHLNAVEGAVMKLIHVVDPDGAARNGVARVDN